MQPDNVELYLPSVLGYEKIARRAAEALAEQMDFNEDRIENLKTAVAEACVNAIEHGNNLQRSESVAVHMTVSPDKLEVRVADIGFQAVPDELPAPGSGDMRGWGMYFIKSLVDEMVITKLPDGGNEVRMTLYLKHAVPGDDAPAPSPGTAGPAAVSVKSFAAIQPVEPKPGAIQPAEPKPSAIQPAEPKPSAIQPAEPKPGAIQPAEPKPSAIQPAEPRQSTPDNTASSPGGSTPPSES